MKPRFQADADFNQSILDPPSATKAEAPKSADAGLIAGGPHRRCAPGVAGRPPEDQPITPFVKRFEEANAAASLEPFALGELTRMVIIEQHGIGTQLFPQKDCAKLSNTKDRPLLGGQQVRLTLELLHLDPVRPGNFLRSWQAGTSDDHFVVNFGGNVRAWKKPIEQVEAAELRQDNQR